MDTTIQKSYYMFLKDFIDKHINILQNSKIFIYGAGTRGHGLAIILKALGCGDIAFVDNDPQKQSQTLEGYIILSFPEANKYQGKHIFLCPIEKNKFMLEQLESTGRKENEDYFNLDFELDDYLSLIDTINEKEQPLLMADCVSAPYILESNGIHLSTGDTLKHKVFGGQCKLYVMPGIDPMLYYHIIKVELNIKNNLPRYVVLLMGVNSLSPYDPMMSGTQIHIQLRDMAEKLFEFAPKDEELHEYLQIITKRLERSYTGKNPINAPNTTENKRLVYRLKYNFSIKDTDNSIVYTRKILKLLNKKNIPVVLIYTPVDYLTGEKYCGEEFTVKYKEIVKTINSLLSEYEYSCVDASFIAESEYFLQETDRPDINPFLTSRGQQLLVNFLNEQEAIKRLK